MKHWMMTATIAMAPAISLSAAAAAAAAILDSAASNWKKVADEWQVCSSYSMAKEVLLLINCLLQAGHAP